jgi:hypothetical protein
MATTVVNLRREKYDIYIGRGSKWGNPFTHLPLERTKASWQVPEAEVLLRYEEWLKQQPELMAALPELRGKRLGCYCAPKRCHGDTLARLADGVEGR